MYEITEYDKIKTWKEDDGLKLPKETDEIVEELVMAVNHIIDRLSEV